MRRIMKLDIWLFLLFWLMSFLFFTADVEAREDFGYHASVADKADTVKWVQVDLGKTCAIDAVELYPADPVNIAKRTPGFGFPVRFRIEASDDPEFKTSTVIADHSQADYPNPGDKKQVFPAKGGIRGRYVRIAVNRLWFFPDYHTYCFALAEMAVLSGDKNIALDSLVTALDSASGPGWKIGKLTDGNTLTMERPEPPSFLKTQAPGAFAERLLNSVPLRVSVGGVYVRFMPEKEKKNHYIDRLGPLEAVIVFEPLKSVKGARWSLNLTNHSNKPLGGITIEPLRLRIGIKDIKGDQAQVRHVTGSNHYDATYPPRAFRVFEERFMTNDHCKPLTYGGRSAYSNVPLMQFALAPSSEKFGFTVIFEWSSTWNMTAQWEHPHHSSGPVHSNFLITGDMGLKNITLDAGETVRVPPVHLIFSRGKNWDSFSKDLHHYILEEITPPLKNSPPLPPVSYDHWFGIHMDFDVEDMKRQANRAAELGCEWFVVDCGWQNNPWGGGTTVNRQRLPNGMEEISEYARAKGMRFGLWNSMEFAAKQIRFWEPQIKEHHLKNLRHWAKDWNVRWMRLEGTNTPVGKDALKWHQAIDDIYGVFLREYPDFYLEGCQGGGTRFDLNMARYSHGTWLSDHTGDPDVCRFNQTGALRVWPAQYLNLAVRVHRNSGDNEAFGHNFLSRMTGTMSFNGDIAQWSPEATALAKKYVDVYKKTRHLKYQPVFFPLPQPRSADEWDVVVFGDGSGGEDQLLFAFRMEGNEEQFIRVPDGPGKWKLLLDNGHAGINREGDGFLLRLDRNSSALWIRSEK